MDNKSEKLFHRVMQYRHWSFIIMSIIVSYHLVEPKSIGGFVFTILLFFPIFILSNKLIDKLM